MHPPTPETPKQRATRGRLLKLEIEFDKLLTLLAKDVRAQNFDALKDIKDSIETYRKFKA